MPFLISNFHVKNNKWPYQAYARSLVGQFLTSNFLILASMFVCWHVSVHECVSICMQTPMSVCLSVCLSVRLSVCKYLYTCMCVCLNEGLIGTLCACCETCLTILAQESSKSVSVQKVSQTDGMVLGGS